MPNFLIDFFLNNSNLSSNLLGKLLIIHRKTPFCDHIERNKNFLTSKSKKQIQIE